jgi:hypothetical protein
MCGNKWEMGGLLNLLQQTPSVSNSLMYSIYKMLPNDTDLTVLENKRTFKATTHLDDHYNYHRQ